MTEADSMVVSMLGDDSDYMKMMKNVEQKTISTMAKVESTIVNGFKSINAAMTKVGTALSIGVTAPLVALAGSSVMAFAEEDQALKKLEAALNANGRATADLLPQYQTFASEMQNLTVVADEVTIAMLQTAESYGLTGDSAQQAVKNAIAMQSAFGVNAESALRMTSQLEKGNAAMLTKYIPTLKGVKDKSEQAAMAQEVLGKAFDVAQAEAKGGLGPYQQLLNSISDLQEGFGKIILEALNPFIGYVKQSVEWVQGLSDTTKQWIVWLGAGAAAMGPILLLLPQLIAIGGAMAAIGSTALAWAPFVGIVAAIGTGVAVLVNWLVGPGSLSAAWDFVKESAMSFFDLVVGFMANFEHNVGALVTWFSDNWFNLFVDAGRILLSFATTSANNIQVMFATMVRLGVAFGGWLAGLWDRGFHLQVAEAVSKGTQIVFEKFTDIFVKVLDAALSFGGILVRIFDNIWAGITTGHFVDEEAIGQAILNIEEKAKGIRDQLSKDAVQGALDPNFFNTATGIIKEGLSEMKGPLDDFVSSITKGPDLLFGVDSGLAKANKDAMKGVKAFDALAKSVQEVKTASSMGVQATEAGSTEAFARAIDFRRLQVAPVAAARDEDPAGLGPKLDAVVEQLKIGNELAGDKADIVLEPVNL